jgi:hypothetical protein
MTTRLHLIELLEQIEKETGKTSRQIIKEVMSIKSFQDKDEEEIISRLKEHYGKLTNR